MKEEVDFKAVAAQLAKPAGAAGVETAERMNISNGDMTQHAVDLLNCQENDRILEIGPGNGRFAEYVLAKGHNIHYTGVDISETMVHTAQGINKEHVAAGRAAFHWTDGLHFPFPVDTFDKIFTVNTLYFWKNPAEQLAKTKRVLKPKGFFCLAFSSKKFMEELPFTAYGFTLYSPNEAQDLLLTNGFEIMDMVIRDHPVVSATQRHVMREEIFILARQNA